MTRDLKARFERAGPVQAVDRVPSGLPADVVIRPERALADVRTVDAVTALVRRGVAARTAMAAIDTLASHGEAVIAVPVVEPGTAFADEMRRAGVSVRRIAVPEAVDVRALRDRLGLTVAQFARRYTLNPRTVEGWEQGRAMDDIARTYLAAIAAAPDAVGRALETALE